MSLWNLIGIGSVTTADDSGEVQLLQITERGQGGGLGDRIIDKVRRIGSFGFASVPPIDSEALMIRRNGERARSTVIGTNHRASRPKNLKPGDTAVYDVRGTKITLDATGITIHSTNLPVIIEGATTVTIKASTKVRVEAPQIECTGDVISRADGATVSLNALHDAYNLHKHVGVTAGTGVSGLSDHIV